MTDRQSECEGLRGDDVEFQLRNAYKSMLKLQGSLAKMRREKTYTHSKEFLKYQMIQYWADYFEVDEAKEQATSFEEMEGIFEYIVDHIPMRKEP